jgi:hypothetical protein
VVFVVIFAVWLVLVTLGVAAFHLASTSDASEERTIREWAFACRRLWQEEPLPGVISSEPSEGEHDDESYRATG